jgi:hypothetical protein
LWAAEKLGLLGASAETYANEVVASDFEEPSHGVIRKLRRDFDAKGVQASEAEIHQVMNELLTKAVAMIQAGK